MLLELNYLKSHKKVDGGPLLSALGQEIAQSDVDPSHLLVTVDWVQYKKNFRQAVDARRYVWMDGSEDRERELVIDMRRAQEGDLAPELGLALDQLYREDATERSVLYLEDWGRPSRSLIWSFNRAFWVYQSEWQESFQKNFVSSLPGGASDGTNPDFWRDRIGEFLDTLDDLDRRGLVPDEIYVLELGVGTGHQGKVWLDTFREQSAERGRDYYRRIRYLMSDYSQELLYVARTTVAEHGDKVSCLNLDVTDPLHALAFLRYKVLFVHSCNLYDNLPTDEIVRRGGQLYEVQARAYLDTEAVARICEAYSLEPALLPTVINRFLRIGPEYFDGVAEGVRFWADVWDAIRLRERYVMIEEPASYRLTPGPHPLSLEDALREFRGDVRMHLSTSAIQSFVNTLPLMHPRGLFQAQDLFVTEFDQYRNGFRGPGKLDGSIVNWLNGPLFSAVGNQLGYDVHIEKFRYNPKSNSSVLTTSQKD